ncbi:MAG: IgGFc-binding protein [Myxococcota bacterium]|nr:IgGFc-binding protein [Myxococcota bacterium]
MRHPVLTLGVNCVAIAAGCGSRGNDVPPETFGVYADAGNAESGTTGGVPPNGLGSGSSSGGEIGSLIGDASLDGAPGPIAEPLTCDQAARAHSYIGCDYWPTVVANNVWTIFDFAVVVANAGQSTAKVTITGPSNTNQTAMVAPGQLAKMYLPWVPALKGPDSDVCGGALQVSSVLQAKGAFHLTSNVPVTVYQFNALEYQPKGGPAGKNWSSCPGLSMCMDPTSPNYGLSSGCFSFSNDASLLLPSTAMTGNYRVAGHEGTAYMNQSLDAYMAITGTQNGTTVKVKVANAARITAGTGVPATNGGGVLTLTLDAGDVAELVGGGGTDLSGSIVQASAPVQLITGHPCLQIPPTQPSCDHMEESVFPSETLGKHYVVPRPAGPNGSVAPHQVRFYGNFDGTHLTYNPPTPPPGCPITLSAGQVVECGTPICPPMVDPTQMTNCGTIDQDFEVQGDQPFAVGTFTLGAWVVDPTKDEGDPAQSFATAVEQYRSKYVFLAPDDYRESYVDIVAKSGTTFNLDGPALAAAPQTVGTSAYSVYRVKLGPGQPGGAHVLTASQPVGIQVVGYGTATSYMYPGGLDLANIAPPPGPIQ